MLTDLLWLAEAKIQYERQKAQGLAGLLAILSVIFVAWKWNDWFYPLFNKIGLISFAEKIGLVHDDLAIITVINVIGVIFVFCLFIGLICLSITALGFLLLIVGASKAGQLIIGFALILIFWPFILMKQKQLRDNHLRYHMNAISSDPEEAKEILQQYNHLEGNELLFNLYIDQIQRLDKDAKVQKLNLEDAEKYLTRSVPSIKDNTISLFAYNRRSKQIQILFPNPLPKHFSQSILDANSEENKYKDGIYGFASKSYLYSTEPYIDHYTVPSFDLEIRSDGEKFQMYLDDPQSISTETIDYASDYYVIHSKEWENWTKQLIEENYALSKMLHYGHMLFYLFQMTFKHSSNDDYYADFFNEVPNVLNGELFAPIYEAELRADIAQRAQDGDEWAIDWIKKVVYD